MIVAVVALTVALAGALSAIVWLAKTALDDRTRVGDARFDLATKSAEVERAAFELEVTRKALEASNKRSAMLEKELTDVLNRASIGDGLDPDDVPERLRRLAEMWRNEAFVAGDPIPAEPGEAMPEDPAAEPTEARR